MTMKKMMMMKLLRAMNTLPHIHIPNSNNTNGIQKPDNRQVLPVINGAWGLLIPEGWLSESPNCMHAVSQAWRP